MLSSVRFFLAGFLLATFSFAGASKGFAQAGQPRLALVIGNGQYRSAPLATAANDAGLVAQTLQAAGFDVTGAADLDQGALRLAFREFVDKVRNAGPDAVIFVYLAGRGVQYAGENYFVPIDATIARDSDVPVEALRLIDYSHALAELPLKVRIIVLDAARADSYAKSGAPLAGGLALLDAEPGSLYAFNAAPGTIAPDEQGPYGIYAQALVEMMHQGFPVDEVFAQTRLRVNQVSAGTMVPWDVSKLDASIFFFRREASAPPLQKPADLNRALRDYPAQEAYAIALDRDTILAYQDFLAAYPHDPLAARIRALLAARREALTWRRALDANSPSAYWTYMRRYPHGPHFADARRRLAMLTAPLDPPPRFDPYDFQDLPPPPEAEYEIVDRPVLIFDYPDYPPPPPPPIYILPERPAEFVRLPPPPPRERGVLPIPVPIPLPFSHPATQAPGVINQPKFGQQQPQTQAPQPPAPLPQGAPPHGNELLAPGKPPQGQQPAGQPPAPLPQGAPPHGHELLAPGKQPPGQQPAGQPSGQPPHPAPQPQPPVEVPPHLAPEHVAPPPPHPAAPPPPHPAAPPPPHPAATPPHPAPQQQKPAGQQKPPPKKDEHKPDEQK
ncbi:MAG: caspase domain-containing protein [Beijerinckiaceae bacterium]